VTFNWWTFLFQLLNFVVLASVLHWLLYRPLREAIARRRAAIARSQAEADQARAAAETLRQQLADQEASLEKHRQELIREARQQTDAERQRLLAETEQTLRQRRQEAEQAFAQEREEALKSLEGEVLAQAVALTRRLLAEASESGLHRQLALRLVESLRALPEPERERLRAECPAEEGAILETAEELDPATVEQVAQALAAAVGRPVAVAVRARPELIGGARLRLGGHVWDGSLNGQLPTADRDRAGRGGAA
jgi:F-type H+-transporting ATPase subunit b